ncbi:hypothetical protein BD324DRAFT_679817 [Kockovaella imperatae]|uniref:Complex 1 protein-domain-containing protein n=1 Tax=Kockovaella imperatae TaxID=4999 RepID=A0A1Y1UP91_9TREE|nr:hypothetical protein BD324DRAFT_679817 [Kockovaella imperatae]ORX39344.1 hypothetical protein BD324DRAFT_679817 [Kockovaella imperatae]
MSGRRSGLQKDVIALYRRGVKAAFSKPRSERASFLLHLKYNFHNPTLQARDVSAIEHQLRKMNRTIEMLEEPSVHRINVSPEMREWWQQRLSPEVSFARSQASSSDHRPSATDRGDSSQGDAQWGHTLPGHGGT